jgi:SAM-dependent methyltransferase
VPVIRCHLLPDELSAGDRWRRGDRDDEPAALVPPSTTGYHAGYLTPNPSRVVVWKVVAEHLGSWVPAGADVLEIGAGYCDWINNVRAARRVAADIWPEVSRFAAAGVEPRVLDVSTDLHAFGAGAFDVVLASNILEHFVPDVAAKVVSDVFSLLRPRGRFIVIQPNFRYAWRRYFDDYTHRTAFTHVSLAALLRSRGFAIEVVMPRFLPYSMRDARVPIAPWLVRAYLRSPIKPMAGQMLIVASRG